MDTIKPARNVFTPKSLLGQWVSGIDLHMDDLDRIITFLYYDHYVRCPFAYPPRPDDEKNIIPEPFKSELG